MFGKQMVEMEAKEWNKVQQRFRDKNDAIKAYQENQYNLELTLSLRNDEIKTVNDEKLELSKENDKLKNDLKISEANLSLVLETLQEAFNTMERFGISKPRTVTASMLDERI